MNPVEVFIKFVREREHIRVLREAGHPPPWTQDEILKTYRFCNIQREHDKVTKWFARNWRDPHTNDPDVWFASAVARHVNLPETLQLIGYPVPWDGKRFVKAIRARKSLAFPAYNAAYMIRASKGDEWKDKADYLAKAVLGKLWKRREELRPQPGDALQAFHQRLLGSFGLGSFMAAQIVADTKYVGPLKEAPDWWSFAASGPGSRRGLNRILGRDPKSPWSEKAWQLEFTKFQDEMRPRYAVEGLPRLHGQDLQNCLCEFSKYMKAYTGEGRPKQKYVPPQPTVFLGS